MIRIKVERLSSRQYVKNDQPQREHITKENPSIIITLISVVGANEMANLGNECNSSLKRRVYLQSLLVTNSTFARFFQCPELRLNLNVFPESNMSSTIEWMIKPELFTFKNQSPCYFGLAYTSSSHSSARCTQSITTAQNKGAKSLNPAMLFYTYSHSWM